MPIYEYQCTECGFQIEVLQKISDEPLSICAECGKPTMKKMVSAAAFRLKGGGWYETDFKSGKKKNVSESDHKKPESKTATKTEKKSSSTRGSSGGGSTRTKKKTPGS